MSRIDHRSAAPPPSDISAGVGLAGVLGLFLWLLFCREWPVIASILGFAGLSEPLSGALPSAMAVIFSAIPMVLWSVFVDKVHRRPSTGLDWNNPRRLSEVVDISITKLAALWATWALIGFVYCISRYYWQGQYLFAMELIGALAVPLLILSVPYVLWLDRVMVNPRDHAWHFGAMLIGREAYDPAEVKHHLRSWAVKGFFIAFMVSILPFGWRSIVSANLSDIVANPVRISQLSIEVLFVIDVQIAMVGYLLTMRPLDSHIRSANPYLAGWLAALICYPPFILMGGDAPLNYHVNTGDWTMWLAESTAALWIWGAILIVLTAIYAWATVAFGIRFSNLTYRGILTNGPYRFTRHPAYLAKNAYWWLATMPFIATTGSLTDVVRNTALLGAVSGVYYWRAKTEEKHLLAEDAKYREYHAWMEENAMITRNLAKLGRLFRPRGPALEPAMAKDGLADQG